MTLKFRTGTFTIPTTAAPYNITVPVGFKTKAFIVYGAYDVGITGVPADRYRCHIGVGGGDLSSTQSLATAISDNVSTSNSVTWISNAHIINITDTTASVYLEGQISQMTDESVIIAINTSLGAVGREMAFIALGGDEIEQVKIDNFPVTTSFSTQPIAVGFKPDFLLIFSSAITTVPNSANGAHFSVGFCDNGLGQGCVTALSEDNENPSRDNRMQRRDKVLSIHDITNSDLIYFVRVTAMTSTGYDLLYSTDSGVVTPPAGHVLQYLAIKGGRYDVKEIVIDSALGSGDVQIVNDVEFKGEGVFLIASGTTAINPSNKEPPSGISMGSADKYAGHETDAGQVATCNRSSNAVTPTEVAESIFPGRFWYYHNADPTASASTSQVDVSFRGFTSDGFDFKHNTNPTIDFRGLSIVFGSQKPYKSMSLSSSTKPPTGEISMKSNRLTVFG